MIWEMDCFSTVCLSDSTPVCPLLRIVPCVGLQNLSGSFTQQLGGSASSICTCSALRVAISMGGSLLGVGDAAVNS